MIKIENTEVFGWEAAIRGMRNPMNSWDKSDSEWTHFPEGRMVAQEDSEFSFVIGKNDLKLMKQLSKAGDDHGKFLRMINVTVDITAPLYWYKEFDTYKIGTVANSCSTMHKLTERELTMDDFSHEHLTAEGDSVLAYVVDNMNAVRGLYLNYEENEEAVSKMFPTKKDAWWQLIQLLPSSYNQKRTIQLNYQVLKTMYHARKNHKLDEWHDLCDWMESLPYFKELCCKK